MHLLKNADENNFFKGDASFLAAALRWNSQRLKKQTILAIMKKPA